MTGPGDEHTTEHGTEHTTEHQGPREVRVAEGHSAASGHVGAGTGEQHAHGAPAHDGGGHAGGDHGTGAHGSDGHGAGGHGGHGDEMTLGPIDMTAWIVGLAGVAVGLVVALCFALSTGYRG